MLKKISRSGVELTLFLRMRRENVFIFYSVLQSLKTLMKAF